MKRLGEVIVQIGQGEGGPVHLLAYEDQFDGETPQLMLKIVEQPPTDWRERQARGERCFRHDGEAGVLLLKNVPSPSDETTDMRLKIAQFLQTTALMVLGHTGRVE